MLIQRGPPPWDLTASVLVAASALVLSLFPFEPVASSAETYLFVLVLLLPGYLLSIALFPRRYDLAGKGRLVVCIGADILLLLLLSLGLSLSPWGLHLSSLAASAAAISLVLAASAHFSRSALPRWNRFVPFISGSGRTHPLRKRETGTSRRMVAVILVLIVAVVLSTFAYTTMNAGDMGEKGEAHFTELYIQGEKGEGHPIPVAAGSTKTAVAGIISHEFRTVNYTLRLTQNGSILSQKEISLDHNQSWKGAVDYVLKDPGSLQRLDFLLYKEGDFSTPYSEDHLWLNVSEANVISENSSESSEDGTVTLQQERKVVVLGAGEDTSSDKKRHSGSGKATSQVASQSASKSQGKNEHEQFSLQDMESDIAKASGQNSEGLQASFENGSHETATSSTQQNDEASLKVSISADDVSKSDVSKSEISESKEKLVATAIDTPSHIPSPGNPETANQEMDTSTIKNSEADSLGADNSGEDNSNAGSSSVASNEDSAPFETGETKAPAKDDPKSETSQTDQAVAKQDDDKGDAPAPDATPAGGEQSVSKEGEASKTSEMDSEIDSWVSTRGLSKSDQSQAYKSKNIQYVKKGDSEESAVLGSQSKTPVRLGR